MSTNGKHCGPANPHPLSQLRTKLIWEGKYDEVGKRGAAALVIAHIHPNARAQPSDPEDTPNRALVISAKSVHLEILDHLIVSPDQVFSFGKPRLL